MKTLTSGVWKAYTPAWSSSGTQPAIGNGTLTGRYMQQDKTIIGTVLWLAGSTTTYGTGNWSFSLPVTAVFSEWLYPIGSVFSEDIGNAGHNAVVALASSTTLNMYSPGTNAVAYTNIYPFTWGDTDRLRIAFTYEAA